MVKASLDEKKMTGNDRTPAWDGLTTGGDSLRNQMNAINDHKVCRLKLKFYSRSLPDHSAHLLGLIPSPKSRSCFVMESR